jgi:hypothetical protein
VTSLIELDGLSAEYARLNDAFEPGTPSGTRAVDCGSNTTGVPARLGCITLDTYNARRNPDGETHRAKAVVSLLFPDTKDKETLN